MTTDETWIRTVFDELIVPDLFERARTTDGPLWIGVGGQPGAGKTHGRGRALRLNNGTAVTAIIGDDLRAYHPDYRGLVREDPLQMPAVTAAASARWVELALEHARAHRFNVLVEGTFRRPEVTLGTATAFHDAGYRTHLVAIAVPPWESQLSSIERFQLDHAAGLTVRWTDPAAHAAGIHGTPLTLDAAAHTPAIDRISVVTRTGATLFDQARPADLTPASTVLRVLYQSPPASAEYQEWEARRHDVVTYLRRELPEAPETTAAERALEEQANSLLRLLSARTERDLPPPTETTDLTRSAEALLRRVAELSDPPADHTTTPFQPDQVHLGEEHRGPSLS